MNSKFYDVLKKIFPIGAAFTQTTGKFVLGCVIHVAIALVGSCFGLIPVLGWILSGAISAYMAASAIFMIADFVKLFDTPAEYVGEDNQVSAILRKIFPVSFKYCNKGKSLAIGIILNAIFMIVAGSIISGISLILTATIIGVVLTSAVNTIGILVNIYFIAAIVVEILVAVDVIKAAKPVAPVKEEKAEEKTEEKVAE